MYWTDGFDGKIGVATIREEEGEGPEVRRGVTFFENIDGVKGIVAVDTDHFIGLQRFVFSNKDTLLSILWEFHCIG